MIIDLIKQLIKAFLLYFGIYAFKRSSRVYLPDEESYKIVAELVGRPDPVIIDGGAHRGDAVLALSQYLPEAEFHCFEPDPLLVEELLKTFDGVPCVHIVKAALGEKNGVATFNINSSRPTNSLLDVSDNLQSDLKKLCQLVQKVEVAVTTIDAYRELQHMDRIDIIKLDLQGFDYNALVGALNTLREVRVVLVEALFTEIYRGSHLFPDILNLMIVNGFQLFTLSGIHYGNSNELLWADAIFIRRPSAISDKDMRAKR